MVILVLETEKVRNTILQALEENSLTFEVEYPDHDLVECVKKNMEIVDDIVCSVDKDTWLRWIKRRFVNDTHSEILSDEADIEESYEDYQHEDEDEESDVMYPLEDATDSMSQKYDDDECKRLIIKEEIDEIVLNEHTEDKNSLAVAKVSMKFDKNGKYVIKESMSLTTDESEDELSNFRKVDIDKEDESELSTQHENMDGDWKCRACGQFFQTEESFDMHVETHKKGFRKPVLVKKREPIQCEYCEKQFMTRSGCKKHTKKHHVAGKYLEGYSYVEKNVPVQCKSCDKTFMTRGGYRKHMINFHNVGFGKRMDGPQAINIPKTWTCQICNITLKHKSTLQIHMKRHSGNKDLTCDVCGMQFFDYSGLSRHRKLHNEEKPFNCSVCGKSFKLKEYLTSHSYIHLENKRFLCHLCSKACTNAWQLQQHLKKHSPDYKPFTCDLCFKIFDQKGNLKKHRESHFGIKHFSCSVCEKKLTSKNALKIHMYTHNDSPQKPYPCDECEKSFVTKYSFDIHLNQHAGKMYRCDKCDKQYKFKNKLIEHQRIHTGERPFECKKCNKKFHRSEYLNMHMNKTHFNDSDDASSSASTNI